MSLFATFVTFLMAALSATPIFSRRPHRLAPATPAPRAPWGSGGIRAPLAELRPESSGCSHAAGADSRAAPWGVRPRRWRARLAGARTARRGRPPPWRRTGRRRSARRPRRVGCPPRPRREPANRSGAARESATIRLRGGQGSGAQPPTVATAEADAGRVQADEPGASAWALGPRRRRQNPGLPEASTGAVGGGRSNAARLAEETQDSQGQPAGAGDCEVPGRNSRLPPRVVRELIVDELQAAPRGGRSRS